jgi:hypothetical protein
VATEKLKELCRRQKAALALKNIEREIDRYLEDLDESVTYEAVGVDTTKA